MHFFSQTTLIYQVSINIPIDRSKINQNRNTLITKLTAPLNVLFMMILLLAVHNCIDLRNAMTKIANFMFLMSTIDLGSIITLILWTICLMMILTTYQTLQWFPTIPSSLMISTCLLSFIEPLVRNYISFLTCTLMSSSLWCPFYFIFLICFQFMLTINFAL